MSRLGARAGRGLHDRWNGMGIPVRKSNGPGGQSVLLLAAALFMRKESRRGPGSSAT